LEKSEKKYRNFWKNTIFINRYNINKSTVPTTFLGTETGAVFFSTLLTGTGLEPAVPVQVLDNF
jgi:hypothetical protein